MLQFLHSSILGTLKQAIEPVQVSIGLQFFAILGSIACNMYVYGV